MTTITTDRPAAPTRSRLRRIAIASYHHLGYRRFSHIHNTVIVKGFFGSGLGRDDFRRVESVFLIAQSLLWTAEDGVDLDWWHDWGLARLKDLNVPIPAERTGEGRCWAAP